MNKDDVMPVGVACASITAGAFGWIQTKGTVGVLRDVNVPVLGGVATLSNITAGAVTLMGGNSTYATYYGLNPILGFFVTASATAEQAIIKMNLE